MQSSIFAKNLAIHFVNDLSSETHYVYDVELENVGVDGVNYDIKNLYCSNGTNVLEIDEFNVPNGKVLLNEGHIVVGVERVSGIVAFLKDVQIANDPPVFEYDFVEVITYSAQIGGV